MANETTLKQIFKASVKAQGGITFSLNSSFSTGLPDLYVSLPGKASFLLECKWLKDVNDKFKRKINYTPLQIDIIKRCNKINNGSAYGLVGFKKGKTITACLVDYTITHIDQNYANYCGHSTINRQSDFFDVEKLLSFKPVVARTVEDLLPCL